MAEGQPIQAREDGVRGGVRKYIYIVRDPQPPQEFMESLLTVGLSSNSYCLKSRNMNIDI